MSRDSLQPDVGRLVSREIDDLLLHIRGLALVRPLLASRGASQAELDAHEHELERLRRRLTALIGGETAEAVS